MKNYLKHNPVFLSLLSIIILKLTTVFIKQFFLESNFLINLGTANGIFKKAASEFNPFLDYFIVIIYSFILYYLYKNNHVFQNKNLKNILYLATLLLILLNISSTIVFQEYRGWDLSLYCVTDVASDLKNNNLNIYNFEYQKIKPGLSPAIWVIYNKICNFNLLGFTYLQNYYWIQIFTGITLVINYFKFTTLESLCLALGLNLSLLHMIRTGNYGYLIGIVLAISLINLLNDKFINLNMLIVTVLTFFKIQYVVVIFLYLFLNRKSYKEMIESGIKFLSIYIVFYGFQYYLFKNSFIDYIELMTGGYLTNELVFEAGITNPVVSQFFSRFFNLTTSFGNLIALSFVIITLIYLKNTKSKFLSVTSLFNRNKSYDANYLLLAVENRYLSNTIFALCFIPNIAYFIGSINSIGPLSELLFVPGLIYVVFLTNKK